MLVFITDCLCLYPNGAISQNHHDSSRIDESRRNNTGTFSSSISIGLGNMLMTHPMTMVSCGSSVRTVVAQHVTFAK
jgi:hypothetical protein